MARSQDNVTPDGKERSPLAEMFAIAAPVVLTMSSYTAMQFVDKLMVSRIGSDPIYVGAQGNGGLLAFVPISIAMGLTTVVNTFVSQNLGAGKAERGPSYVWAALWMVLAFWVVLLLPYAAALPWVVGLVRESGLHGEALTKALARDAIAAEYGRILLVGAILTMSTRAVSQFFYGMHRPMVVLIATVGGNLTNVVLNSLLIYGAVAPKYGIGVLDAWFEFTAGVAGSLGIPRLEVAGAAYATLIGTAVELLVPLGVFLSAKYRREFGTTKGWRPSMPHIKDLFRIGWPGAIMFGNEMICWAFFMVYLVGMFGSTHSTAGWIAHQYMSLSFMPTVGISVAITAMVGKCLGMGRPDLAEQRAWLGMKLAVGYMTLCAVVFVVFREQLIRGFVDRDTPPEQAAELVRLGSAFLIATAAFQFFDGIAMSLSGALRGAGDTRWPGIATVLLSWSIIVLGGWLMVTYVPRLESLGAWMAAATYIVLLSAALLVRFMSGRWKEIRLLEGSAGAGH